MKNPNKVKNDVTEALTLYKDVSKNYESLQEASDALDNLIKKAIQKNKLVLTTQNQAQLLGIPGAKGDKKLANSLSKLNQEVINAQKTLMQTKKAKYELLVTAGLIDPKDAKDEVKILKKSLKELEMQIGKQNQFNKNLRQGPAKTTEQKIKPRGR